NEPSAARVSVPWPGPDTSTAESASPSLSASLASTPGAGTVRGRAILYMSFFAAGGWAGVTTRSARASAKLGAWSARTTPGWGRTANPASETPVSTALPPAAVVAEPTAAPSSVKSTGSPDAGAPDTFRVAVRTVVRPTTPGAAVTARACTGTGFQATARCWR